MTMYGTDLRGKDLAIAVWHHIVDNPEQHRQDQWLTKTECGTVACFAGWTALLAGAEPAWRSGCDSSGIVHLPDDLAEELGRTNRGPAECVAIDLLGITVGQADDLFSGANDLGDIREVLQDIYGLHPEDLTMAPAGTGS